jgi:molecular chaperone GrpE
VSDPAKTQGDPLVPEHHEERPVDPDAPVAVPEDTEPPQGDPVTHGGEGSRQGHGHDGAPGPAADDDDPVAAAEARAQEYLDLAQRKQAEFENFRKRMNLQAAQAVDRGVAKLAKELLPALDHLERALETAEKHEGAAEWVHGIRLVQEEVLGALGRVGIQPYAPYGEPFDPNEHEAVAQQPHDEHESGTVSEVYQQGYRLNGAVLRPARVVVAA